MSEQRLTKLNRPEAGDVLAKRKVYVVRLMYPFPTAPTGYVQKLKAYWEAVDQQITRLESRAGPVKRVFHEGISKAGQGGLDSVEQINGPALFLIKSRITSGAVFESFEDEDLFTEVIDWTRCLQIGVVNPKVSETLREGHSTATRARAEHIAKRLDEGLGQAEAALVITSSLHGFSLPQSAEVFNVVPPELDALERWIREASDDIASSADDRGEQDQAEPNEPEHADISSSGSKLWTPP